MFIIGYEPSTRLKGLLLAILYVRFIREGILEMPLQSYYIELVARCNTPEIR